MTTSANTSVLDVVAQDEAASAVSQAPTQVTDVPGLPRLNYNLWDHKTKLFIVSGLLVIESSILPIALYYGLWYGTTLRHGILFAIITSFFGLITGIEFALRCWKLCIPADTFRPLGGKRWRFDFTHMTLSFGYTVMTGILVGASIPNEPLVRPLAIPVPLFFIQVGLQLLVTGWAHSTNRAAPFRISSVAKGQRTPLLVFTLIEDVVAVDGGAGKNYRQRLMARYKVSPQFRKLLTGLNWFWGIGAVIDGVGTMVVIWTVPKEIAYGVGWGSPLVFCIIWVAITLHWTRSALRHEKIQWAVFETKSQNRADSSSGGPDRAPDHAEASEGSAAA